MRERPRLFDRRVGSLLVVVAILAGAVLVAADTFVQTRAASADLAGLEERVGLLEKRAAELAGEPDATGEISFDRRLLVFGETPGLVTAELQRTVGFIAERTGAELRSVDVAEFERLPDTAGLNGESLQRVRLNAEFEVPEQALADFLYNIEADFPVLIIDGLTLRTTRRIDNEANDLWTVAEQRLSLRMTISAFWTDVDG